MNSFSRDYAHRFGDDTDIWRKYGRTWADLQPSDINWPFLVGVPVALAISAGLWWVLIQAGKLAYVWWRVTR